MKSVHPAIRFLTATVFILLMSGFVAFKSGAFEDEWAELLPLKADKIVYAVKHKSNHKVLRRRNNPFQAKEEIKINFNMISSSKTVGLTTPLGWSQYTGIFQPEDPKNPLAGIFATRYSTMMSGSKSSIIAEPFSFPAYQGTASERDRRKVKQSVLKQGIK